MLITDGEKVSRYLQTQHRHCTDRGTEMVKQYRALHAMYTERHKEFFPLQTAVSGCLNDEVLFATQADTGCIQYNAVNTARE